MIAWLLSKNGILVIAFAAFAAFTTAVYLAGGKSERRKVEAGLAKVNVPLAEQRGQDEAEIAAEADKAKTVDELVKAALSKRFILDRETAELLGKVR